MFCKNCSSDSGTGTKCALAVCVLLETCTEGCSEFYLIFWICVEGHETLGFGAKNNHETNFGPPTAQLSLIPEAKGHFFVHANFVHAIIFAKHLVLLERLLLEIDQCFRICTRDPTQNPCNCSCSSKHACCN